MTKMLWIAGALALAACAAPVPEEAPSFRDRSRPIASAALFDAGRFEGTWHVVARYPVPSEAGCAGTRVVYGDGLMQWQCLTPEGEVTQQRQGLVAPGPWAGRLAVDLGPGFEAPDFWVIWVDFDYRTAVIGSPDGRAGWVLNRDPVIPADRMAAAREMLDFNGYDLSRLVTVP